MSEPFYEANERLRERKRIENDRDAEIERLQARVDGLTTWISVKDLMPEPGQRVIIFGKRSYQPKGFMRVTLIDGYGVWSGEHYPEGHNEVTHWMDVPEPPK